MMYQYKKISIDEIRRIETAAYPSHMLQLDDCEDLEDIAEYAECSTKNLRIFGVPGHWYIIIAKHRRCYEIVDVAKVPNTGPPPWREIIAWMIKTSNAWKADLREKTSLKIFEKFDHLFVVKSRETWDWEGEKMVETTFIIRNSKIDVPYKAYNLSDYATCSSS